MDDAVEDALLALALLARGLGLRRRRLGLQAAAAGALTSSAMGVASSQKGQARVVVGTVALARTIPRLGPFRVLALVWVRCPRTGRPLR